MKHNLRKRIIALVLSLAMVVGCVSTVVAGDLYTSPLFAAETGESTAEESEEIIGEVTAEDTTESETVTQEVTLDDSGTSSEETDADAADETALDDTAETTDAADETATVDGDAATTDETADAEQVETSEESVVENENGEITISAQIGETIVTLSGPTESFPEGSDYSIEVSELTQDAIADVEAALRKVEKESDTCIASYQAYDIKLIVDGEEAQPLGDVNVTFSGAEVEEQIADADGVEVYHVDETEQTAEAMAANVEDNAEAVEMTTDHFSTYVLTTNSDQITITVESYVDNGDGTSTKLYRDKEQTLTSQEYLELTDIDGYTIEKVVRRENDADSTELTSESNNVVTEGTYRVYYEVATTKQSTGDVQMFDYQVRGYSSYTTLNNYNTYSDKTSINSSSNYATGSSSNDRLSVGIAQYYQNQSNSWQWSNSYVYNVTLNGGAVNTATGDSNTKGIVTGINTSTGALTMATGLYEPGLFTQDSKEGKQILNDYSIYFDQTGFAWTMTGVWDDEENGDSPDSDGSNFYPLDSLKDEHPDASNTINKWTSGQYGEKRDGSLTGTDGESYHNDFFGMRYDISFTLGDYVGDLSYSFSGDDDLWVFLDAGDGSSESVILDIGGIHNAITGTVDIWEELLTGDYLTAYTNAKTADNTDAMVAARENFLNAAEENRTTEHTITIVYMERGAWASNCTMSFVIPNAHILENKNIPTSDVTFNKISATETVTTTGEDGSKVTTAKTLQGAVFALYDVDITDTANANATATATATSDANGQVKFEGLRAGTYYMKEISAPWGYALSDDIYVVTVQLKENSTTELEYTIRKVGDSVTEYETTGITNTLEATRNVNFTKIWDDFSNKYNTRPASLTVTLTGTANNKEVETYTAVLTSSAVTSSGDNAVVNSDNTATNQYTDGVTVSYKTSSDANRWKCTWSNLPVKDTSGNVITWTVSEGTVSSTYSYTIKDYGSGDGSDYTSVNTNFSSTVKNAQDVTSPIPENTNSDDNTDVTNLTTASITGGNSDGDVSAASLTDDETDNTSDFSQGTTGNWTSSSTVKTLLSSLMDYSSSTASLTSSGDSGVSVASDSDSTTSDENAGIMLAAYDRNNNTWDKGGIEGGGSSGSTFSHIDIEADGSYSFTYAGVEYTLKYDFEAGTWQLYKSSDTSSAVTKGTLDVTKFTITNITQNVDVGVSGKWQSSTTGNHTSEYRVSGTFTRTDQFQIHYEIPVTMPDGVTINLIADFVTYYSDTNYNVCPGKDDAKGIDIEMESALADELEGSIILTKTLTGLEDGVEPTDITFQIKDGDGNVVQVEDPTSSDGSKVSTITYAMLKAGSGSIVISGLAAGTYTIEETNTGTATGYKYKSTTVTVNGTLNDSTTATAEITKTETGLYTVTFNNEYTSEPQNHTLTVTKIWNGGTAGEDGSLKVNATVTYDNGESTEIELTKGAGWQCSWQVSSERTIKSVVETTNIENYTASYVIGSDGTSAVITNNYANAETTTLTVQKVWNDEGYESKHDDVSITVGVYKTGTDGTDDQIDTTVLSEANNWTATFTNLIKLEENGENSTSYYYTVKEIGNVAGYTTAVTYQKIDTSGSQVEAGADDVDKSYAIITNTLEDDAKDTDYYIANKLDTVDMTVTKYWNDSNNKYGSRPTSIALTIAYGDTTVKTLTLGPGGETNTANGWQATITLPKLLSGTYSLSEPSDYSVSGGTDTTNGYQYQYGVTTIGGTEAGTMYLVNAPTTTQIEVTKIWNDGSNALGVRPDYIQFELQYVSATADDGTKTWTTYTDATSNITGKYALIALSKEDAAKAEEGTALYNIVKDSTIAKAYGVVSSTDSNYWYATISGLPATYEYRIAEVSVDSNYETSYSNDTQNVITNTLQTQLIKKSSTTTATLQLNGAKFELENQSGTKVATAESKKVNNVDGMIEYTMETGYTESELDGSYILTETQAPAGYSVSETSWELVYSNGVLVGAYALDKDNNRVEKDGAEVSLLKAGTVTFYIDNDPLYSLPSSGGSGIYTVVFSGMLMMICSAFALMTYRKKQRGRC